MPCPYDIILSGWGGGGGRGCGRGGIGVGEGVGGGGRGGEGLAKLHLVGARGHVPSQSCSKSVPDVCTRLRFSTCRSNAFAVHGQPLALM